MKIGVLHQYPARSLSFVCPSLSALPAPKLSIALVTPSYQQASFLPATIESVLDQGYPDLRYAVIDGGSTDGSAGIIAQYQERLAYAISEPDGGQSDALRRGFEKVSGDIMGWLNSDDLLLPGSLDAVARYFAEHPEVDVVYGHRIVIDAEGKEVGRWLLPSHHPECFRLFDMIPQETCFWRRSIWEKVGGIDSSFHFAMDWDLFLRFEGAGARFRRLPLFLGCFRVHSAQKTSSLYDTTGQKEVDRLHLREFGRKFTPEELRPTFEAVQCRAAWVARLWERGIWR